MRFSLGDQVFWARRTLDHEFWIIRTDIQRQHFWFIWGSNTPRAYNYWTYDICHMAFMNHRFVYLATLVIGSPFKDDCDESRVTNTIPKSVLNPHSLPVPLCLNTCVQCEWFVCDKVAMYIALCSLVSCRFRHLSCGLCDTLWTTAVAI